MKHKLTGVKLSRNSPVCGMSTVRAGFEYKTHMKQLSRYTKQLTRITLNETCVGFKSLTVEGFYSHCIYF